MTIIQKALNAAGYHESEATVEDLIECYLDYSDAYGGDIDDLRENIATGEITVNQMCKALDRG